MVISKSTDALTIALSKGRILQEALPLLARIGIEPRDDPNESRKLIFLTNQAHVSLLVVRAADVPTYVEYGAADVGIAGRDVLLEYQGEGLYEPLDLGIARCRLVVAAPVAAPEKLPRRVRVATKYVESTRRYYAERGEQVDIIKLSGAMELAPLVGLADKIVDLADTGNTLKAHGLAPLDTIAEISARLVVNKAAMKMKHREIKLLIQRFAEAVA